MATLRIQSAEIEPFWATPEILLFLRMRFFNFFFNHMVQMYQNEIAPIFYYGISTKTNEKNLKIPNLQPPDWNHPYWMSLYLCIDCIKCLHMKSRINDMPCCGVVIVEVEVVVALPKHKLFQYHIKFSKKIAQNIYFSILHYTRKIVPFNRIWRFSLVSSSKAVPSFVA